MDDFRPDEPSLTHVLDLFHYRLDSGEQVTPEQLIQEYPQLADRLQSHFRRYGQLYLGVRHVADASSLAKWIWNSGSSDGDVSGNPALAAALERFELAAALGETPDAQYYRAHAGQPDGPDLLLAVGKWPQPDDAETTGDLLTTATRLTRLEHEGLHRLCELRECRRYLYSVSRFHPCSTLSQRLAVGPVSWRTALSLTVRMAEAVAVLHQHGLTNGNLHPDHVLMAGKNRPVLTSYSLPRLTFDWGTAPQGQSAGDDTASLLAPETFRDHCLVQPGPQQDVYSLAALLVFAVEGGAGGRKGSSVLGPSSVRPGSSVGGEMPKELTALCQQAMADDPDRRPADAAELASLLRAVGEQHDQQ